MRNTLRLGLGSGGDSDIGSMVSQVHGLDEPGNTQVCYDLLSEGTEGQFGCRKEVMPTVLGNAVGAYGSAKFGLLYFCPYWALIGLLVPGFCWLVGKRTRLPLSMLGFLYPGCGLCVYLWWFP